MKIELTASELKELMDNSNQETQSNQELGNLRIELAGQIGDLKDGLVNPEQLLKVLMQMKDTIDNVMEN